MLGKLVWETFISRSLLQPALSPRDHYQTNFKPLSFYSFRIGPGEGYQGQTRPGTARQGCGGRYRLWRDRLGWGRTGDQCPAVSLGLGQMAPGWAEMGSWGKGRVERSQVVLIRLVKAHKCHPGPEVAPSGARLQPGACPGAERRSRAAALLCGRAPLFGLGSLRVLCWMENKLFVPGGEAKDWCNCLPLQLGTCIRPQD